MKKIKSIKQLRAEKRSIMRRKEDLEDKIRGDWNELKDSLRPANVAREALSKVIRTKTEDQMNGESILKNTFTYGVSLLANRLAEKAEVKFGKIFKRKRSLMPSKSI